MLVDGSVLLDDGVVAASIFAIISASTAFSWAKISAERAKVASVTVGARATAASSESPAY